MAPSTQPPLAKGDVLAGRYRVERVLGYGGMGVVAKALDLRLDREVAVKVLRPEGDDTEALVRFDREAKAVSRLRSEHVVRVLDSGKLEDGKPFLVMELLVGEDLEAMAAARYLDPEETAGYILQACEGLAEAHAHGLVHRDLKPPNLFVARWPDGQPLVKVIDFGIAKHVDRRSVVDLTEPLTVMGSSSYLSPEQARGREARPSSDVWALGVCLYELLTRTRPFVAESAFDVIACILKEAPERPETRAPGLPPGLGDVVMRCLEKDVGRRYADVAELAEALEPFAGPSAAGTAERVRRVLETPPGSDPTPSPRESPRSRRGMPTPAAPQDRAPTAPVARRSRVPRVALALVMLLLLLGLAAPLAWRRDPARTASATGVPSPATASSAGEVASPTPSTGDTPPPPATGESRVTAPVAARAPAHGRSTAATAARPGAAKAQASAAPAPPAPLPAETAPAVAPVATQAPVAPPRFALASARVELGSATSTVGTTPANVSRLLASQAGRLTACYREALPRMSEPLEGSGRLHVDTDEDGTVVGARLEGPVSAPGRCMAGALAGKRLPNVDTGRASADVPVRFVAQ